MVIVLVITLVLYSDGYSDGDNTSVIYSDGYSDGDNTNVI